MVHPAIVPVDAQIVYVAYNGWIYSGRQHWSFDKVILTDSYGKKMGYCKEKGEILRSGFPMKITFKTGVCLGSPEYPLSTVQKVIIVLHVQAMFSSASHRLVCFQYKGPTLLTTTGPKGYNVNEKRPTSHRLKPSTGQDVVYTNNLVLPEDSSVSGSGVGAGVSAPFSINDEVAVAPLSSDVVKTALPQEGSALGFDAHKNGGKTPGGPEIGPAYQVDHSKVSKVRTSKPHISSHGPGQKKYYQVRGDKISTTYVQLCCHAHAFQPSYKHKWWTKPHYPPPPSSGRPPLPTPSPLQ